MCVCVCVCVWRISINKELVELFKEMDLVTLTKTEIQAGWTRQKYAGRLSLNKKEEGFEVDNE